MSAVEAKSFAQGLAFGPFAFYAAVVMRDSGLLAELRRGGAQGMEPPALATATGLSEYGVSILLDYGANLGLVHRLKSQSFALGKVGHFILDDQMTEANMNFTRDVCYAALPHLEESLRSQTPAGLHTLGPWKTLYEGLTEMPEPAKTSWFKFDHYYSDRVFDTMLPIIFENPVRELLDVGGNTGRWALKCLAHDPDVMVTLVDFPAQLAEARRNIAQAGYTERARFHAANLLDDSQPFYEGADVLWMSQFLDCFSEDEIRSILRRAAGAMTPTDRLFIVEHFPDRQVFDAAAMSLDATSLYFACVANGNSRMYHYDRFKTLVHDAGLRITRKIDNVGVGHTALCCTRA